LKSTVSSHVVACAQVGAPLVAAFVGLSLTAQLCGLGRDATSAPGSSASAAAYAQVAQAGYTRSDSAAAALESTHQRDLGCLTEAVYYEARGESVQGQAAVAQVVLNRVRSPAYPRSICGVVFQAKADGDCQFSFVCNGAMRHPVDAEAWRRAREIADRALDGYVMRAVGPALNFHVSEPGHAVGAKPGTVAHLGRHVFFVALTRPLKPHKALAAPDASPALDRPILDRTPDHAMSLAATDAPSATSTPAPTLP
jgi:hypothetical protein